MAERVQIQDGFRHTLERLGQRGSQLAQIGYLDLPVDFNFLRLREDATVDYLPTARTAGMPTWDAWYRETGRQQMKFGRWVRKIKEAVAAGAVNERAAQSYGWECIRDSDADPRRFATVTDDEITEMVNRLRDLTKPPQYAIVTGADIVAWYHGDKMTRDEDYGNLYSCMVHRYEPRTDADYDSAYAAPPVRHYAAEPNCGLAIATLNDKLVARCLIWTATNGRRYYDKFYGGEPRRVGMRAWLESQGIDDAGDCDFTVALTKNWRNEYGLPYLDTMTISRDGTKLYGGGGGDEPAYRCDHCGDDIEDEDDAYHADYGVYCGDCYGEHICSYCDGWNDDPGTFVYHPDFGHLCPECQVGRVCAVCETPLDQGHRRAGATHCDPCAEKICEDCGEYDPATECGYCPDCIDDHTCKTCLSVAWDIDDGRCNDCAAEAEGEDE